MKELGIQFVVIDPHDNCTASTMGDKWIAPRPGTDAALAEAIGYVWLTEDTYDHFFVENRTYGFDEWKKHILGEGEDGRPRPRSGRPPSATSRPTPSRRWRASGRPRRPCWPWPASSAPPAPAARPTPPSGAGCASTSWPCRASASRGSTSGAAPARAAPAGHGLPHVRLLRQRLGRLRHRGREGLLPGGQPGHPEDLPPSCCRTSSWTRR